MMLNSSYDLGILEFFNKTEDAFRSHLYDFFDVLMFGVQIDSEGDSNRLEVLGEFPNT
jgi:hypothetical protein